MNKVDILYDIQHFELSSFVENAVKKVENLHDIKINMNIVDPWCFLSELQKNPNYNVVILHIGLRPESAYNILDKCKRISDSNIYVAESVMFPQGYDEVLNHFNDYIGQINEEILSDFLMKYGYISSKE
jgi:hypothetical protein